MKLPVPKLYGTFMPTWTPAHLEFGFAAAARVESDFNKNAVAGTPASASLPNSRREYSIVGSFSVR